MEDSVYNAGNVKIFGNCEKGYAAVKEAFVQNFVSGQEVNASLCVYVDQKCVIDLFGSAIGDNSYTRKCLQVVTSHLPQNSIALSCYLLEKPSSTIVLKYKLTLAVNKPSQLKVHFSLSK